MKLRTLLIFIALAVLAPLGATAQVCSPACHPDETLRSDGYCEHDTGFPTYARSHRANDCAPGAPVNASTGICTPAGGCGGGGGRGGICSERPVCAAGEEFRDGGCYPPCNTPGACSHTRAICDEGWTLDASRGVCRNCRIHVVPGPRPFFLKPDLVFRTGPAITPARPSSKVPNGRPYSICFTVANTGGAASGAFRVAGAGLGVSVAPFRDFASLAAGAMVNGCVVYPTTPAPGHYTVELTIDSLGAVNEAHEDNNTGDVVVNVVP